MCRDTDPGEHFVERTQEGALVCQGAFSCWFMLTNASVKTSWVHLTNQSSWRCDAPSWKLLCNCSNPTQATVSPLPSCSSAVEPRTLRRGQRKPTVPPCSTYCPLQGGSLRPRACASVKDGHIQSTNLVDVDRSSRLHLAFQRVPVALCFGDLRCASDTSAVSRKSVPSVLPFHAPVLSSPPGFLLTVMLLVPSNKILAVTVPFGLSWRSAPREAVTSFGNRRQHFPSVGSIIQKSCNFV